jgi:glycosyltransferase involved in cell wall biosynthesis
VACSGELYDIPASYQASRWLGLPFHAYLFDDYVHQWTEPGKRRFARAAEWFVMRGAAGVIVPNEFLADEYRRRHGVEPTIVRNPYDPIHDDIPQDEGEGAAPEAGPSEALRIVFTGSIYHAHFEEFRRLSQALESIPGARLHVYTAQDPQVFRDGGIDGALTVHPQVSPAEAAAIQRGADVLYLPLGFSSSIPEVMRTSAPGKLGDYLRAGRAVLAHVPADSFVAHWFRSKRCGLLVDRPDAAALRAALLRLRDEAGLRAELAAAARDCAREFSVEASRRAFLGLLESDQRG